MKYVLCYFKLLCPVSLYFGALDTGGERGVHIIRLANSLAPSGDYQPFGTDSG